MSTNLTDGDDKWIRAIVDIAHALGMSAGATPASVLSTVMECRDERNEARAELARIADRQRLAINPRPIQQGVEVRGVVLTAINHGSNGWVTLKCEGRVLTGADREALLGATVRLVPEGE